MRFLHTADWHVGKTLRGRSRLDETAAVLDEVVRIAVDSRVDTVLLAGDVFDSPAPPAEAERLVYDFLARLLPERIACVMIAGNHDHPKKLAALSQLLEGLRIYVRGEAAAAASGGVVELPSRDGSETACVAALPFIPERRAVEACRLFDSERSWAEAYAQRIQQLLGELTRGLGPGTVNVLMAHLLVSGGRVGSGVRPLHVGDQYGVEAQQLPAESIHYVALGHLHRPQEVGAGSTALYSGSLIELDFGETEQEKRVVLVEAHPGDLAAQVESIPLQSGRRLRDVEGTLEQLEELAEDPGDDFLRVSAHVPAPTPGVAEQIRERLPNALDVRLVYERSESPPPRPPTSMEPCELFAEFYQAKHGSAPVEDLMKLFREVYEEASSR